jgi:hypothetical protein
VEARRWTIAQDPTERQPEIDFGFWIADSGFSLNPKSKITNPKSMRRR